MWSDNVQKENLSLCLNNTCPEKVEAVVSLIQERSKMSDLLETIKVSETVKTAAGSVSQIKCKAKISMGHPEQTIHFISNNDSTGEELIFSEAIGKIKGRNQCIFIEAKNPTKSELVLKRGKKDWDYP